MSTSHSPQSEILDHTGCRVQAPAHSTGAWISCEQWNSEIGSENGLQRSSSLETGRYTPRTPRAGSQERSARRKTAPVPAGGLMAQTCHWCIQCRSLQAGCKSSKPAPDSCGLRHTLSPDPVVACGWAHFLLGEHACTQFHMPQEHILPHEPCFSRKQRCPNACGCGTHVTARRIRAGIAAVSSCGNRRSPSVSGKSKHVDVKQLQGACTTGDSKGLVPLQLSGGMVLATKPDCSIAGLIPGLSLTDLVLV